MVQKIKWNTVPLLLVVIFTMANSQYNDLTDDLMAIDTIPASKTSDMFLRDADVPKRGGGEASAIADFNNDGVMDFASGASWYEGPDFTASHVFRGGVGDYDDMMVVLDVNGDGWVDLTAAGHYKGLLVYLNPGDEGSGNWPTQIVDEAYDAGDCWEGQHGWLKSAVNYHSGTLWDVNGDGVKAEIVTSGACHTQYWLEVMDGAWVMHQVSEGTTSHQWGSGAGDVNGDGRPDILRQEGWYEAPEDPREGEWVYHPATLLPIERPGPETPDYAVSDTSMHADNMFAWDVNGDGLGDILSSAGHGWGIFWYEQKMDGEGYRTFVRHTIDETVDNLHTLEFEDMDSDGDPDLVTGRRTNVDDGAAPRPYEFIYWYELRPGEENPWVRHVISFNDGISTGTRPGIGDIDGDGDLDLVTNHYAHNGPSLFINQTDHGPPIFVSEKVKRPKHQPALKTVFHNGSIYLITSQNETNHGPGKYNVIYDVIGKKQILNFMQQ